MAEESRTSDVIHVVSIQRRRGTAIVQLSPPRPEESCQLDGARSSVGAGVPTATEHVPVAPVRSPGAHVADGGSRGGRRWRRPADGGRRDATTAQRRRRVGPVVVGDHGEDDGVHAVAAAPPGVRRPPTPHLPQRHAQRVDVGRRGRRRTAQQLRGPVRQRPVEGCRRRAGSSSTADRRRRPRGVVVGRRQTLRTAEVRQFTTVRLCHDHVGRLHVEVDQTSSVNVRQSRRDVVRVAVHNKSHTHSVVTLSLQTLARIGLVSVCLSVRLSL